MTVYTFEGRNNNIDHSSVSFVMDGDPSDDKIGVLIPEINTTTRTMMTVSPGGTGPRILTRVNYTDDFLNGFTLLSGANGYNREADHNGSPLARAYRFEGDSSNPAGAVSVATTGVLQWLTSDDAVDLVNIRGNSVVLGVGARETISVRVSHSNLLLSWTTTSDDPSKVIVTQPRRVLTDIIEYDITRIDTGTNVDVTLNGHRIDGGPDVTKGVVVD